MGLGDAILGLEILRRSLGVSDLSLSLSDLSLSDLSLISLCLSDTSIMMKALKDSVCLSVCLSLSLCDTSILMNALKDSLSLSLSLVSERILPTLGRRKTYVYSIACR